MHKTFFNVGWFCTLFTISLTQGPGSSKAPHRVHMCKTSFHPRTVFRSFPSASPSHYKKRRDFIDKDLLCRNLSFGKVPYWNCTLLYWNCTLLEQKRSEDQGRKKEKNWKPNWENDSWWKDFSQGGRNVIIERIWRLQKSINKYYLIFDEILL